MKVMVDMVGRSTVEMDLDTACVLLNDSCLCREMNRHQVFPPNSGLTEWVVERPGRGSFDRMFVTYEDGSIHTIYRYAEEVTA